MRNLQQQQLPSNNPDASLFPGAHAVQHTERIGVFPAPTEGIIAKGADSSGSHLLQVRRHLSGTGLRSKQYRSSTSYQAADAPSCKQQNAALDKAHHGQYSKLV